jgi:hypothetical protein
LSYISVKGRSKRKSIRVCALFGGNKDNNEEHPEAPEKKVYTGILLASYMRSRTETH